MPTADRRSFVPRAIHYFQSQDYENKELVIVDDGKDSVADLVPDDPQIRYVRLSGKRSLGAKRNECVEACRSDLIMHWDDDDWMASHRISYQVEALIHADAEVCGLHRMIFYNLNGDEAWLYQYPDNKCPWLAGGSLLYTRDFWRRSPFPNIQVASDTRFVWDRPMDRRVALDDYRFYVAMAHATNTSTKDFRGSYWTRYTDNLESLMGEDLSFYQSLHRQEQTNKHVAVALPVAARDVNAERSVPTYSIIMVVHNALEMTRLSTLETLRRIDGQDARLVIVDNASSDGSEEWLRLLARRGDINLIRSEKNLGHGPALELARSKTSSPYIVALDSDAFPLSDDWLTRLRALLNERVKVSGILHHRDYIHPSCLMISRETLDEFRVSFLNEKDRPSQLDVAERISHEVKRRGYQIAGLNRTSAQRRGSVSEPVYLGSEYEGIVYHQWYTTRAVTAPGVQVDDVPAGAIEGSLQELFERHAGQTRTLTVVMGVRVSANEPQRLKNAKICLQALNLQDLPRWQYRIIVVEQDHAPQVERELAPYVDKYIFAYNPGPYNRGWGFNVGAAAANGQGDVLCLIDADLLVQPDFLRTILQRFESGKRAVQPYTEVVYLDARSTDRAIKDFLAAPMRRLDSNNYRGRLFSTSQGGCIWVASSMYYEIGGHHEGFRGWGREDREFWDRLSRFTAIEQLPGRQLHLDHPRPAEEDRWALANHDLYDRIAVAPRAHVSRSIGSCDLYECERGAAKPVRLSGHSREWENWHRWEPARIRQIVFDEKRRSSETSNRQALAEIVVRLGDSLLDLGCGPGALWRYFENYRPRFSWVGADVTQRMLKVAHDLSPAVPVSVTDAGNLPFINQSFDVVVLRHVLEHMPQWLMERALAEVMRVARRTVVVDFYVAPNMEAKSETITVGGNFLETCWSVKDLEPPIANAGWIREGQLRLGKKREERDVVWILRPGARTESQQTTSNSAEPVKVSIVMPTYRRSHTLFRTIRTIRNQTYRNWELIIIDNEGTADYQFSDPRIRVYAHRERASASFARNRGLKYVSGDLVCFFDDDDDMFPNYLEKFVRAFESHPKAKMVRCGMIVSGGRVNFSYATPECCLRREFAVPQWVDHSPAQDQIYFNGIVKERGWSESKGDIVTLPEALCHANWDPKGGLRSGRL